MTTSQTEPMQGVRIPLPPGDNPPIVRARSYRPELAAAMDDLHAAAMLLDTLDPATTETVRLRCAEWHDCRLCMSLRLTSALPTTLENRVDEKVGDYEHSDLSEAHKVALRLTEAFTTGPANIDAELRSQVLEHFSKEQVVEILLDIISWSQQKPLVSLQLEIPTEEISELDFDPAGHAMIGAPI